jgi:hypothetical protein
MTHLNFSQYKTYAFHKKALTGRNISLDKKILNAIDYELGKRHDQK